MSPQSHAIKSGKVSGEAEQETRQRPMKRILLISYNFAPELTGIGKYNGEMIDWFVRNGYDCHVLTGYPYYPEWRVHDSFRKKRFWFSFEQPAIKEAKGMLKIYRCPFYVPQKPSGVKRLILEVTFLTSALIRMVGLMTARKYDLVIAVAPSFQLGLLGLLYKWIRGARLAYHIQDLQIEAARDLGMINSRGFLKFMFFLERLILRHADVTSSVSEGMLEKIRAKGGPPPVLFPNWTNTSRLYPVKNQSYIKESFGFNASDKIVLYSGAIGEKQGIESIVYAAQANRNNGAVRFVICGSGPYKKHLEELAGRLGLRNIVFLPLQDLNRFNQFLNIADLHLVIQKAGAGDLVMPSKLANILAVGGLALVTANRGTSLHKMVTKHEIGYVINCDDQEGLNEAVATLLSGDFEHMRIRARNYAVKFISQEGVMRRFDHKLNSLWRDESQALESHEEETVEAFVADFSKVKMIDEREIPVNNK